MVVITVAMTLPILLILAVITVAAIQGVIPVAVMIPVMMTLTITMVVAAQPCRTSSLMNPALLRLSAPLANPTVTPLTRSPTM